MEQELFEHILATETLSNEMKDVVDGLIKHKVRVILLLKTILLVHIIASCTLLYFYPEILSINSFLVIAALIINIGTNLSLFVSVRLREKKLAQLINYTFPN
jgi:hypothetical protein